MAAIIGRAGWDEAVISSLEIFGIPVEILSIPGKDWTVAYPAYYKSGIVYIKDGYDLSPQMAIFLMNHEIGHRTIDPGGAMLNLGTWKTYLISKFRLDPDKNPKGRKALNYLLDCVVNLYQCQNPALIEKFGNLYAWKMQEMYSWDPGKTGWIGNEIISLSEVHYRLNLSFALNQLKKPLWPLELENKDDSEALRRLFFAFMQIPVDYTNLHWRIIQDILAEYEYFLTKLEVGDVGKKHEGEKLNVGEFQRLCEKRGWSEEKTNKYIREISKIVKWY